MCVVCLFFYMLKQQQKKNHMYTHSALECKSEGGKVEERSFDFEKKIEFYFENLSIFKFR